MRPSPHRLLSLIAAVSAAVAIAAIGGLQPTLAQTGAPSTPALLGPANGAIDVSPTLTLSWTQPAGAIPGTTVYKVFPADWNTDQNLPTLTTTGTSLAVPASEALQYGHRYFWSVQACNGSTCSAVSGEWDFFVQGPPGAPGHATLVSATPSTTPTFTWNQPSGATAGSTVYVVGIQDDASGAFLPNLPPTTSLSTTAPSSEQLVLGHTYDWAVNACNGSLCSGFGDQFVFTTASGPGTALELSPVNGASVTLPTPQNPNSLTLSWSQPVGAIPGTTFYIVSLYDPYGEPQGHFLGDLPSTTGLSLSVPVGEGLLPGQSYDWNVEACNGTGACSGYSASWWSFSSALAPLASASGAGTAWIVNPDFGGSPKSNGGAASGWAAFSGGPPPNEQYWSTALTLDFTGTCVSGGSCSSFRVGYALVDNVQSGVNNGSAFAVTWFNTQTSVSTQLFYDARPGPTPANTWVETEVQVPANLGATGEFDLVLIGANSDTGIHYPSVAYIDRLDGPSARGVPAVGVAAAPRFPKALSAATGSGVDTVTGEFQLGATDISVPGVAGTLSFTRAYSSRTLILPGQTPPIGNRWSHNWQAGLLRYGSGGTAEAVVVTPGGGTYTFLANGGGWSAAKGVNATLITGAGQYTLTTVDQRVYTFAAAPGGCGGLCTTLGGPGGPSAFYALSQIADRNGNTIAVTTNAGGDVTQVTDTKSGRYLAIAYRSGQIVSVNDNAGRIVFYGYTGNDLTGVGTMLGGTILYSYDAGGNHWLAQATDPREVPILTNTYDSSGRVATQQDAGDGTTRGTLTYHYQTPSAGITQVVDQRGKTWSYYFDSALRTTDLLTPTNVVEHWDYESDNNVVDAVVGQAGNLSSEIVTGAFTYDSAGNQLTATDALGYTTTTTYNSQNEPLSISDPLHHLTTNTYDVKGNLTSSKNAGGFTTSVTLTADGSGRVASVTDPLSHTVSYGYGENNSYSDRTSVTDALTHKTTTAYDAAGRVTSVTDPLGHVTSYSYTISGGEVDTATVDPGGVNATTTTTLNTVGQKVSVQDPNGNTTSYSYDPRGLLHIVTDALGHQTVYGYDAAWNRTGVTDANGKTTSYSYNDAGQALTVIDPNTVHQHTYTYDTIGRVSTHVDARTITSTFSYDLRGAVTQTSFSNGDHAITLSYDADGNRLSMSDASGTTSYVYDALNRPTSITDGNVNVLQYSYDAAGNRTQIVYPVSARPVTYYYDAANRLYAASDWTGNTSNYYYDAANRLVTVGYPTSTGITEYLAEDNANRLTVASYQKNSTTIAYASYTLDAAGNRTSKTLAGTDLPGGATTSEYYCLDALNRVTSVRTAAGCAGGTQTAGYAYDNVGNRTSLTTSAGTTSYGYDAADQLTSVTPPGSGATTYAYDANGNQTNKGVAATFTWNALNQLKTASQGGNSTTNVYNGDGFRLSRTDNPGNATSLYTWDTAGMGQILDDSGSDQYLYGATGLYSHVTSSQTYYFLTDGLGSVLAEVKSDGTNAVSYTYDVYGNITNQTGAVYDERQFAGEQADPTGLTYLRARFYDATTGRFLSRDPKDGWSYSYAADNPALNTDPRGLCDADLCQGFGEGEFVGNRSAYDVPGAADGELGRIDGEQQLAGWPVLKDSADSFGGLVLGLTAPLAAIPCDSGDCGTGSTATAPTLQPTPQPTPPAQPTPGPRAVPAPTATPNPHPCPSGYICTSSGTAVVVCSVGIGVSGVVYVVQIGALFVAPEIDVADWILGYVANVLTGSTTVYGCTS